MSRFLFYSCVLFLSLPFFVLAADTSTIVRQQIGFDTTPPSIPDNVLLDPVAPTQIDISWDASTDNWILGGYELWRDGMFHATITAPTISYNDTGLSASTTYAYTVRAFDETGNYSDFSTSTATTTPAVPVVVSTTTPEQVSEGGVQSSMVPLRQLHVTASPLETSIRLTLESARAFRGSVSWGVTQDGDGGTLLFSTYRKTQETLITGLLPHTTYRVNIVAEDGSGHQVTKTILVTTTRTSNTDAPANPSFFTAQALLRGVQLSWLNPTDTDFDVVRVMRLEGAIPLDPYDGVIVYEGPRELFLDTDVVPGHVYGYTIFARDTDGNYSSGAVAYVRAYDQESYGEVSLDLPPDTEGGGTPDATSPHYLDALQLIQDGSVIDMSGNTFTLQAGLPFELSLPASVVPRVLKTIVVTLHDPDNPAKTFSFLLRANASRDRYVARISGLTTAGRYHASISLLDIASQHTTTETFVLNVTTTSPAVNSVTKFFSSTLMARVVLIGTFILLFLYALLWLWRSGRRDSVGVPSFDNNML